MLWRAGRPPRGGVRKACGEPPGRNQRERSRAMNRSAEDGEWSSPHDGGEGTGVPPRRTKVCAGDTGGRASVTQGGLVSSIGKVWLESCHTRRRKGEKQATQSPA